MTSDITSRISSRPAGTCIHAQTTYCYSQFEIDALFSIIDNWLIKVLTSQNSRQQFFLGRDVPPWAGGGSGVVLGIKCGPGPVIGHGRYCAFPPTNDENQYTICLCVPCVRQRHAPLPQTVAGRQDRLTEQNPSFGRMPCGTGRESHVNNTTRSINYRPLPTNQRSAAKNLPKEQRSYPTSSRLPTLRHQKTA
jgi:hypothetical protein